MNRDSNIESDDNKALDLIVRIQEHFIANALMDYCGNVIGGEDDAIMEGIQYGLWKSTDTEDEINTLMLDFSTITGTKIEDFNGDNFNEALSETTKFFISNMTKFVFTKNKITYGESVENIIKLLKTKKRSKDLEIWLRFYLRIKHKIIKESDEEECELEEHEYIG